MEIKQWWDDNGVPRLINLALSDKIVGIWRNRVLKHVTGDVVELGFGSGRSLPYYAESVTRVYAIEPSDIAWSKAADRIAAAPFDVVRIGLDGARIALDEASVQAVVSTWTMCTIPDLAGALSEVKRVLRPGGSLHFVEHSLAPDKAVATAQRIIQPVWGPVVGGCHLNRDIPAEIVNSGLMMDRLRTSYAVKLWPGRPWAWFTVGAASKPG
ncbi:MAG: class I SAM-dependent methyltransferase [Antricoccus sp.]